MSCSRYRQLISRYVDGEVTPRQRAELLAHVEQCHDCAAWLARARQTDVLLKGIGETRPSDHVRDAILTQIRSHNHDDQPARSTAPAPPPRFNAMRLGAAGLLLRFDLSPRRIVMAFAACMVAFVSLGYWFNLLPPIWGYNGFGFVEQPEARQASVNSSPIPIPAISSGLDGVGGAVAVPNLVRSTPADNAASVAVDAPLRVRFDQPMDRTSVESSLRIYPPAAGAFSWDADNELRFTPASPGLLRGVTYTVTLSNTARSLTGTPLGEAADWTFSTARPYSVVPGAADGSSLAPTTTLSLQFDVPVQRADAQSAVTMQAVGSPDAVPVRLDWDDTRRLVTVTPLSPLPEGYVYLRVASATRTDSGETLGQPYEFKYRVEAAKAGVRLLAGRLALAQSTAPVLVPYSLTGGVSDVGVSVYTLPGEKISALGAQANTWPAALPAGFTDALQVVAAHQIASAGANGTADLGSLPAGLYLIVANASDGLVWQMLVVADRALATTGSDSPLWATNDVGRPWEGAEVSLYSASGALLAKGFADADGLWLPGTPVAGARLALARDPAGHVAALEISDGTRWGGQTTTAHAATLITDMPDYRPGQSVNFRVLLPTASQDAPTTPVAEQDVAVLLLTPEGAVVSSLKLKPDNVGGVSGSFPLAPTTRPGTYILRITVAGGQRDLPVRVVPSAMGTLSVYILPDTSTQVGDTTITRTVSVLGPVGEPAIGAVLTATMRIRGDTWTQEPVVARTDRDGRATLVVPVPSWFLQYNEPGLYLQIDSQLGNAIGSHTQYVDLTSQRMAQLGTTQLAAPSMNVAVVARPVPDAPYKVRVVLIDQTAPSGDVLVLVQSQSGEHMSVSLDMARLLDATIEVPQRFAGGTLTVSAAGKQGARSLRLMPAQEGDANLRVLVPYSVTARADFPVRLSLTSLDGIATQGTATLRVRRLSGASLASVGAWEPDIDIDASGLVTGTLAAPNEAGLYYVMADVALAGGGRARSWGVVQVLPGPWVQVPTGATLAGAGEQTINMVVHNPADTLLSSSLRAEDDGAIRLLSPDSQALDVPAGSWRRLSWRLSATQPGHGKLTFSLMPSSGVTGSWSMPLSVGNVSNDTTYTAGVLTGERSVGVSVPSGLSAGQLKLEIRASNSLLGTLAGIANDLPAAQPSESGMNGVSQAAAQLSGPASIAIAFNRLEAPLPADLELTGVERSLLLQALYSAQGPDGSWSYDLAGQGAGSLQQTSEVLLALRRAGLYTASDGSQVQPDPTVLNRALTYLSIELARPISAKSSSNVLDERAFALYVLSQHRSIPAEWVRPLLAYTGSTGETGANANMLSLDGQAWLALALRQSGNSADAVALVDRILSQGSAAEAASAPMLEALVEAGRDVPADRTRLSGLPDYAEAARTYTHTLMENRMGSGWRTPSMTANSLWALGLYAVASGEKLQPGMPSLMLGDRAVQNTGQPGNSGTVSVVLSGNDLHPGVNWLKLMAPNSTQSLYYSLTLIATR